MPPVEPREAVTVRWTPRHGAPQRVEFEPRAGGGWLRVESYWNGCRYVETGRDVVEDLTIVRGDDVRLP